jgi:hypothetical protein
MPASRVTIDNIRIKVQHDNYPREQEFLGSELAGPPAKEADVSSLKRARILCSLKAEGSTTSAWELELIIGLRAGFVRAKARSGGKETTDFVEALQLLVSLLTHPAEGGHAHIIHNQAARRSIGDYTNLLHMITIHKGMVLMMAPSGDRLLGMFHDIRDFCPLTLTWT